MYHSFNKHWVPITCKQRYASCKQKLEALLVRLLDKTWGVSHQVLNAYNAPDFTDAPEYHDEDSRLPGDSMDTDALCYLLPVLPHASAETEHSTHDGTIPGARFNSWYDKTTGLADFIIVLSSLVNVEIRVSLSKTTAPSKAIQL